MYGKWVMPRHYFFTQFEADFSFVGCKIEDFWPFASRTDKFIPYPIEAAPCAFKNFYINYEMCLLYSTGWAISCGLNCFYFYLGFDPLLKLMAALGSTGWCVLGCWVSIYSRKVLFCHDGLQVAGEWAAGHAAVFSCYLIPISGNGQRQSGQLGIRHQLDFCLQNSPDRKVQRVQVRRIWQPICWSPEFWPCPELLGSRSIVSRREIYWKTYFPSGYMLWTKGTTCHLKTSW